VTNAKDGRINFVKYFLIFSYVAEEDRSLAYDHFSIQVNKKNKKEPRWDCDDCRIVSDLSAFSGFPEYTRKDILK
jgi:hypothetical protein